MTIRVTPRTETTQTFRTLVLLGSLLAGLVAVGIVFAVRGVSPFLAIWSIFRGSFGSAYGIKETITKAVPLILIGSGLALAYRAKFWNIGAESQLLLGAVFATWVGLTWGPHLPGWIILPLMFTAGFIGGALWGTIPAVLKIRFGINEVISTLMLNYVAAEIVKFLVVGPWKGETKFGYPYTDDLPEQAILRLLPLSRISPVLVILAIVIALALTYIIFRTRFGYEIRVIGESTEAARYAGINFFRTLLLTMVISGGVAGIAGVGQLSAIHHNLSYPETISAGYGFTAIIVAWLGKLNPAFVILSGLFFAGIVVGGDAIQMTLGLPAVTVSVFNGFLLVFLIAGDYLLYHRVELVREPA